MGNGFGLHCQVHDDAFEIGGLDGLDLHGAFVGDLEQWLQAFFTQQAAKATHLRGVARQAWLVVGLAAEELPLHVLDPALDQFSQLRFRLPLSDIRLTVKRTGKSGRSAGLIPVPNSISASPIRS
jgi:hypothetical protein